MKKQMLNIYARALCVNDGSVYFYNDFINSIVRYDLETHSCKILNSGFGNFNETKNYRFYYCKRIEDSLLFIPYLAENLGVYNIASGESVEYKIPESIGGAGFAHGITYENKLFMFGHFSNKIVMFDHIESNMKVVYEEKGSLYIEDVIEHNEKLFAVSSTNDSILVLDPNELCVEKICTHSNGGYNSIAFYEEKAIMAPNNDNCFFFFDLTNRKLVRIENRFEKVGKSYRKGIVLGQNYYAFPSEGANPIVLGLVNMKMSIDENIVKFFSATDDKVMSYYIIDESIYFSWLKKREILKYNMRNCEVDIFSLNVQISRDLKPSWEILYENEEITLGEFLALESE